VKFKIALQNGNAAMKKLYYSDNLFIFKTKEEEE